MLKNIFFVFILSGLLLFISCSTYIIHLQSFKEQFDGMDTSKLIDVIVQGPMYEKYHYRANSISTIQCRDKDDVPSELQNSPSIEARFTYGYKHKRVVFYFDKLYISNGSLVGCQSRFISSMTKTIPLDSITKIEVQDGKKKFTYVNR